MQKRDWVWLFAIVFSAVAFSVWGLPYFTQLGHPLWSLIVYVFFVTLFIYGRANRMRHAKRTRKPQHLQQK
jgi:membrane protein YdbS with pleckstrin-like domain